MDISGWCKIFRNMLLEQLSRLPHAPSVPFQTTPPITKVPEEVGGHQSTKRLELFSWYSLSLSLSLSWISLLWSHWGLVGYRRKRIWIKDLNLAFGMERTVSLILMKMRSLELNSQTPIIILLQMLRWGKALCFHSFMTSYVWIAILCGSSN